MSQTAPITTYVPDVTTLTTEQLQAAREQVTSWLSTLFPDLDTRPNSAAGDLVAAPVANLLALWQLAGDRFLNDLDMSQVAQGAAYNCPFVTAFLSTLGMSQARAQASTGVVLLTYTANQQYVIDLDSGFQFGSNIFHPLTSVDHPQLIIGATTGGACDYRLFTLGVGTFGVLIPVAGPAGAVVTSGSSATTDLTDSTLASVLAVADFNPGSPSTSLEQMAKQLPAVFPTSTPVTPAGAISWANTYFPNLSGVSPVVSGDKEMIRDQPNILGIREGKMDLHIRGEALAEITTQLTLCADPSGVQWIGGLPINFPPVLMNSLQTAGGAAVLDAYLVGLPTNTTRAPAPSCAYSALEQLGLVAAIGLDDSLKTFGSPGNTPITATSGSATLVVTGYYSGYWFSTITQRNILLAFNSTTILNGVTYAVANITDAANNDFGTVYFSANSGGTAGVLFQNEDAIKFLGGLNLVLTSSSGAFVPSGMVGQSFSFGYAATTAAFDVLCTYDPTWLAANQLLQRRDHRPPALDVLPRGFVSARVDSLQVYYRKQPGTEVSKAAAIQEIFQYINSALYPGVWEDSKVGEIMLYYGAAGMQKVEFTGVLFPSVAQQYRVNGAWVASPPVNLTTPYPNANYAGVGLRNVGYVCVDSSVIELIALPS